MLEDGIWNWSAPHFIKQIIAESGLTPHFATVWPFWTLHPRQLFPHTFEQHTELFDTLYIDRAVWQEKDPITELSYHSTHLLDFRRYFILTCNNYKILWHFSRMPPLAPNGAKCKTRKNGAKCKKSDGKYTAIHFSFFAFCEYFMIFYEWFFGVIWSNLITNIWTFFFYFLKLQQILWIIAAGKMYAPTSTELPSSIASGCGGTDVLRPCDVVCFVLVSSKHATANPHGG